MSIKLMTAVWELDLPQGEKLVLLAFADFANEKGSCFPSVARIAWKSGYSERQAQRVIANLKKRGLLMVLKEAQRHSAPVYRVRPDRGDILTPFKETVGVTSEDLGVTSTTLRGDIAVSPESSITVSKNQPSTTFACFWDAYPKKLDKKAAEKAWKKVLESEIVSVMTGLGEWCSFWNGRDEQFIPYPSTWLNKRHWENFPPPSNGNGNGRAHTDKGPELTEQARQDPLWQAYCREKNAGRIPGMGLEEWRERGKP